MRLLLASTSSPRARLRPAVVACALVLAATLYTLAPGQVRPAHTFTYSGNLAEWQDPSAWTPRGVPAEGDTVTIASGEPLFLDAPQTIARLEFTGGHSPQIIGRGAGSLLSVSEFLTVNKSGGVARLRGHTTSGGASRLAVRANRVHVLGGRLSLGEYHDTQADRALAALEISSGTRIEGGAIVEVFALHDAPVRFSNIEFGAGGGALCINNGTGSPRTVYMGGLSGGPDAVVAANHARTGSNHTKSSTILELAPSHGEHHFRGVIADRFNGPAEQVRLNLVKLGNGTQTLSGANTYGGTTTVRQGVLMLDGTLASVDMTTVYRGAAIGGSGTMHGSLTLNPGAAVHFRPGDTLTVRKSLHLAPGFGVGDLRLETETIPPGEYTIIDAPTQSHEPFGIENLGPENSTGFAGRRAYLRGPGLVLVVQ